MFYIKNYMNLYSCKNNISMFLPVSICFKECYDILDLNGSVTYLSLSSHSFSLMDVDNKFDNISVI